jgi:hypothetical protein
MLREAKETVKLSKGTGRWLRRRLGHHGREGGRRETGERREVLRA